MKDIKAYMDDENLVNILEQYQPGSSCDHEVRVKRYCLQLFDFLAGDYALTREERNLLEASAWLHDIGHSVSVRRHDYHTRVLINDDLCFDILPGKLRSALAIIAGGHRKKVSSDIFKHKKKRQKTIYMLTSILRVADAIDYYRRDDVSIEQLRWDERSVVMSFKGSMLDLIFERIKKKGSLFEEMFASICLEDVNRPGACF